MPPNANPRLKTLLKVSGEMLGNPTLAIDVETVAQTALGIAHLWSNYTDIALVMGGGNILRRRSLSQSTSRLTHTTMDYMGMLSTVLNGAALADHLRALGIPARLFSSIPAPLELAEPYSPRTARLALEEENVVLLSGGSSNSGVSTDTGAMMRAWDLECDCVIKTTKYPGIFTEDPSQNPHASKLDEITYIEVLQKNLAVMDMTAVAFAMEHDIPLFVTKWNMSKLCAMYEKNTPEGTWVYGQRAAKKELFATIPARKPQRPVPMLPQWK